MRLLSLAPPRARGWRSSVSASPLLLRPTDHARLLGDATNRRPPPPTPANVAALPLALETFRAHTGHFVVPYKFTIPTKESAASPTRLTGRVADARRIEWPEELRGLKMETGIRSFFSRRPVHPEIEAALRAIGFPVNADWRDFVWEKQRLPALRVFRELHGHCLVPVKGYVVPRDDDRWPVETWGLGLSSFVNRIRSGAYHLSPEQIKQLRALGFCWGVHDSIWFEKVMPAFETYKQVYGDLRIGRAFVVPSEVPWPRETWRMKLGMVVNSIRNGKYLKQVERDAVKLDELGFVWDAEGDKWDNTILPALETYSAVFGNCNVPQTFKEPSEAPWPRPTWGLNLGVKVSSIRDGIFSIFVERDAAKLEEIGFVWDSLPDRWENAILPAFEAFYALHNHCNVPKNFQVPSDKPWPMCAWGLKLGFAFQGMKYSDAFQSLRMRDTERLKKIKLDVVLKINPSEME